MNKIAFPDNNGEINQHFGRSTGFTIVEIDDEHVSYVKTVSTFGLAHNHQGLADLLKQAGVETVVVGGIGPGAISALSDAGIKVLTGATGTIISVAGLIARGEFVSQAVHCGHGGCGGHDHQDNVEK